MLQDRRWKDEDGEVHGDNERERYSVCRGGVEAFGPRKMTVPQSRERCTKFKMDHTRRENLNNQNGDDSVAQSLLKRHHTKPNVLKHDRQPDE